MGTINRGVSLLESMIAMLLFMVMSVGWISLEANLAKTSTDAHILAQAVFVGQSQVERMRDIPFDNLASSTQPTYYDEHGAVAAIDATGLIFGIEWDVTTPDGDDNLRRIEITVSWNVDTEMQDTTQIMLTRVR